MIDHRSSLPRRSFSEDGSIDDCLCQSVCVRGKGKFLTGTQTHHSKLKIDLSNYGLASRTNKNIKIFIPRGKVENRGETVFFGKNIESISYTTTASALERRKSRPEGEGNISICKKILYFLFLQAV